MERLLNLCKWIFLMMQPVNAFNLTGFLDNIAQAIGRLQELESKLRRDVMMSAYAYAPASCLYGGAERGGTRHLQHRHYTE
jgi:hypothetical protein